MEKSIFMIHGRSFKPGKKIVYDNWKKALRFGIAADFGEEKARQFDQTKVEPIYFGHHSNRFLKRYGKPYDREADIKDRKKTLNDLTRYTRDLYQDKPAKAIYNSLPGRTAIKESFADTFGTVASMLGIGGHLISWQAPDMKEYWNPDSELGSNIRMELTVPLAKALAKGNDILLVSHSLGTLVAYDVLWKFSYYGEYAELRKKKNKITTWLTLGSPLGDETVKKNLKGAAADGCRKYPDNIKEWVNVAAEDDFIAYDEELSNDYRKMEKRCNLKSIRDEKIYNFATRKNKSNPHHSTGYLIHPRISKIVVDWMG